MNFLPRNFLDFSEKSWYGSFLPPGSLQGPYRATRGGLTSDAWALQTITARRLGWLGWLGLAGSLAWVWVAFLRIWLDLT